MFQSQFFDGMVQMHKIIESISFCSGVSILVFRWNGLDAFQVTQLPTSYFVSILVFRWNGLDENKLNGMHLRPDFVSILVFRWNGLDASRSFTCLFCISNVSILVFRWNGLDDLLIPFFFSLYLCFNPSFSMEWSRCLHTSLLWLAILPVSILVFRWNGLDV